jgi:hypothetical protein
MSNISETVNHLEDHDYKSRLDTTPTPLLQHHADCLRLAIDADIPGLQHREREGLREWAREELELVMAEIASRNV